MSRDKVDHINEQQLEEAKLKRFPFIKFDECLENEFRTYRHQRLLKRVPAIGFAGIFIFFIFALLDIFTLPESAHLITATIRLFLVCPLIALIMIAAKQDWPIRTYNYLYMSVYIFSGLSISLIMYVAKLSDSSLPYDGILLHLVFGYFLMGSPYTLAAFGGLCVSSGYFVAETFLETPAQQLTSNAAFIITLNFMGVIGSFMQERSRRSLFLNKKLVELAKAKDQQEITSRTRLLATASHDLRQPLHAMNLLIETLEAQLPTGKNLTITQTLKASIEQLSQLLSSLLNISRLNAGIVEVKAHNFDLSSLMKSLLKEQELRVHQLNIAIHVQGPAPCLVKSDPILIERIARNLCENVFQHANASELRARWFKHDKSIRLEIADNGKGIPDTEKELVFEEFHQSDSGHKHGMGLGLTIVKQLCDLLDIPYGLKTSPQGGACFWIELQQAYSLEQGPHDTKLPSQSSHSELSILLVDDDEIVLNSCAALLKKWGYQVNTANSPEKAIELFKDKPAELIICDYRFPDSSSNGIELIQSLRKLNQAGGITPAILITADTQSEVNKEVTQSFSQGVLNSTGIAFKPLAPAKLRLMVQHYLRQAHS